LTIAWCGKLRALPRGIGKLGALKELTLCGLNKLQEMPDLIGLTALGSLTIGNCGKLRALPRGIGKLGALRELTLRSLNELQEIPDLIGLTALGS
jgi:Leucine-rich repeat (LRR) protein